MTTETERNNTAFLIPAKKCPTYTFDWIANDHAFCSSECEYILCWRHPSNIKEYNVPHTFSAFKGTSSCELSNVETSEEGE